MAGVRKMPMPTTRLNTTIAVSNVDSRARMVEPGSCAGTGGLAAAGSFAMQGFVEELREPHELVAGVVQLRGDAQQETRVGVHPGLDRPCAKPVVQPLK